MAATIIYTSRPGTASEVRAMTSYSVFASRVWGEWTYLPYLRPVKATEASAPNVSSATLEYDFGRIKRENHRVFANWLPYLLNGCYIAIYAHRGYASEPIWVGVTEHEQSTLDNTTAQLSGRQTFQCQGLEHLLDRVHIDGSYTDDGWVARPIEFNLRAGRGAGRVGNRSSGLDEYGAHMFSGDGETWTAMTVLNYLVVNYASASGLQWIVDGQYGVLDSMVDEWNFSGMTARQAINELVDRRRGLGWRVISFGAGVNIIYVYSLLAEAVAVGDAVYPPNENRTWLNMSGVNDAVATYRFNYLPRYNEIFVRGGPVYTCCTLSMADSTLEAGWTTAEETAYKQGTGTEIDDPDEHDAARKRDIVSHVYTRLQVPTSWNWFAGDGIGVDPLTYTTAPAVTNDGYVTPSVAHDVNHWHGHYFERELPLLEPPGESVVPDYRAPFVLVQDEWGDWHYTDKIEDEDATPFGFMISGRELSLTLRPRISHVMALNHWATAYDSDVDPLYDYTDALTTQMFATDSYLYVRLITAIPEYGEHPRSRIIEVPDAVAWYVTPNTVVDCQGSTLYRYGDTGYAAASNNLERDDSYRLRAIAALAAVWYGRPHNTMQIDVRDITVAMPVGTMIVQSYAAYTSIPVRTVVTARAWDFRTGRTVITTGWDELQLTHMTRGNI